MATDGPTPPDCDPEIFKHGQPVLAMVGSSNAIERWVKAVAEKANARVDWHYSGGIAQVLHLGNKESRRRVEAAVDELSKQLQHGGNPYIYRRFSANRPRTLSRWSNRSSRRHYGCFL